MNKTFCSSVIYVQSICVLYIFLFLGNVSNNVSASNWAQVVGKQRQNIVTPAPAGFSPRWGHTAIHTDTSLGVDVIESMIVMGGDTVESKTQNQDIVSHTVKDDFLCSSHTKLYFKKKQQCLPLIFSSLFIYFSSFRVDCRCSS